MIDRYDTIRTKLCDVLRNEYVAFLEQRGTGIWDVINSLIIHPPPISGMKFIRVALSQEIDIIDEFMELFIERLIEAIRQISSEREMALDIRKTLDANRKRTSRYRLRIALDKLGRGTTARYLVIVLDELARVAEAPLKSLLLMLREYHEQRDNPGQAGEKIRFLVAGDARLWRLCYYKPHDVSPFNIAQRFFLDGLSYKEIETIGANMDIDHETVSKIHNLTGGIPLFIKMATQKFDCLDDISAFFSFVQDNWNSMPSDSQDILKQLIEGSENCPPCHLDHGCPQIPELDSPWFEAFWAGFLRVSQRSLTWRSPIHQAFVMEKMGIYDKFPDPLLIQKNTISKFFFAYRTILRDALIKYFDEIELKDLCFDLGIDYDNLPASGKGDKARELISYCERHSRIPELEELVKKLRPHIDLS